MNEMLFSYPEVCGLCLLSKTGKKISLLGVMPGTTKTYLVCLREVTHTEYPLYVKGEHHPIVMCIDCKLRLEVSYKFLCTTQQSSNYLTYFNSTPDFA